MYTKEEIFKAISTVKDPEVGFNLVEMGLIYDATCNEENAVLVTMTLSTKACPLHQMIVQWVKEAVMRELENIKVVAVDSERMTIVKNRLRKAVEDLKEAVDENRFEQELIYYLEKYDITEEKVRLKNHLNYFNEALASSDSNGKKIGFICQEIGREINTIGSKSNHAPMQQLVVQMKDELEKIKEQSLNVL